MAVGLAHGVQLPPVALHHHHLTAVVAKTSAGAVSYLPVARVPNIPSLLKDLQKRGLWIFGTDSSAGFGRRRMDRRGRGSGGGGGGSGSDDDPSPPFPREG